MNEQRLKHLEEFYGLIGKLDELTGGARTLCACSGRQEWPRRGVYFFMEDGEDRRDTGIGARIVRIGTHGLKHGSATTLWNRLSQHRGQNKSGGGNHRGSIFRLIVGASIIARDGLVCASWDNGDSSGSAALRADEMALEREVSKVIGAMRVLWLTVDDEPGANSARGDIERNAIALLSNYGKAELDAASSTWLGRYCTRERVRASGLWNSNHVDEAYDPSFLRRMSDLVQAMDA